MQASLNRRLSTLERRYGPLMTRPSMIGDMTTKEFASLLSFDELEEFKEALLILKERPDEKALLCFDRLYTTALERKTAGLI